jgi:hypothetical protein
MILAEVSQVMRLLKDDRAPDRTILDVPGSDPTRVFVGIRCPLCQWRPSPSSVWSCIALGTPEPFFKSCGTVWNTFATRGRCPGCSHQWRWTSCLRCHQWSLHDDWYEESNEDL